MKLKVLEKNASWICIVEKNVSWICIVEKNASLTLSNMFYL